MNYDTLGQRVVRKPLHFVSIEIHLPRVEHRIQDVHIPFTASPNSEACKDSQIIKRKGIGIGESRIAPYRKESSHEDIATRAADIVKFLGRS